MASVRSHSPACTLATLVSTAASKAVDSAMPATVTAVRTRFFASVRTVKRVKMPISAAFRTRLSCRPRWR